MATSNLRQLKLGDLDDELTDPVTGLVRPASQHHHLELALLRARRGGTHVGVVVVDIDDFSDVLAAWGWAAADEVLAEVGRRIERSLREGDVTSRLGGDRFASVCEGLQDPEAGPALERRVRAGFFAAPLTLGGSVVPLSLSIGAAVSGGGVSAERLIWEAERALHRAELLPPPTELEWILD